MSSSAFQPVLPAAWMQVLQTIEHSLTEAVQQVTARTETPVANDPSSLAPGPVDWQRVEDRLGALQQGVERAVSVASEADAALTEAIEGLRQWLDAASHRAE